VRLRVVLLAALLVIASSIGVVSISRVREQLAALDTCNAVERGDWDAALAASDGPPAGDETGRTAAECRCLALLARNQGDACVALLERVLADPAADGWAPRPELSIHLIQTWRDQGREREAAELARRAGRAYPLDPDLFYLELVTRGSVEPEDAVLRELRGRVPAAGPVAARMRVSLANRYLLRGDPVSALDALGPAPPADAGEALGRWFETRGRAFASAANLAGLQQTYEAWRKAGAKPAELEARYALTLSLTGLADPSRDPLERLRAAFAASQSVGDPKLREALAIRLIFTLVAAGRQDEALAFYDRVHGELALEGLSRDELERSATQRLLASQPAAARRGQLVFRFPPGPQGDELWLSPEPDAPADADYTPLPIPPSRELKVERGLGAHPTRWVYRDAAGRVRASGTITPHPGDVRQVQVEPRAVGPLRDVRLDRGPADGRRRVLLVLPDCMDWRILQYLRARDEMPVLDTLLREGYRAVLDSDPPLTAAAMEALVWPERRFGTSFVGLLHQVGVELAGLSSIGDNPFDALRWVLPEERDLFATVGAGPRRAANLLFSHGGIRAGRNGEISGPDGAQRRATIASAARDLTPGELDRWPELASLPERDAIHVRTIAAELDAAEALASERDLDLAMLRIEPLDILTHAHFADSVRDGQDDGQGLLFSVYRYIDARLDAVADRLDEDDVLVVMSDHGIRTAMEHSRDAIFVAVGQGLTPGRAPQRPHLRGVPRILAGLVGVQTDWPDTGIAPATSTLAALASAGGPLSPAR
jgi:hypothetical protein